MYIVYFHVSVRIRSSYFPVSVRSSWRTDSAKWLGSVLVLVLVQIKSGMLS
jgi:hypothetical protein